MQSTSLLGRILARATRLLTFSGGVKSGLPVAVFLFQYLRPFSDRALFEEHLRVLGIQRSSRMESEANDLWIRTLNPPSLSPTFKSRRTYYGHLFH